MKMQRVIFICLLLIMIACTKDVKTDDDVNISNIPSVYGDWVLYQIKDIDNGKIRLPKEENGIETGDKLYFLKLQSDGKLIGKTLVNDYFGNYVLSGDLQTRQIDISLDLTTEVFEPKLGDGDYLLENIKGNLIYKLQDGKLFLFFENNTKCFIFKLDTL